MKNLQEKNKELDLFFLKKMYKSIEKKENFFTLFFDKLAGTDKLRKQIENGMSEEEIKKTWQKDIEKFKKIRLKYLLYE